MNKEDIKKSIDRIEPGEAATRRMLQYILHTDDKADNIEKSRHKRGRYLKSIIPAAALVLLLAGGSLTYHLMDNVNRADDNSGNNTAQDMDAIREDYVAKVENQFQIDNKHYILLTDEQRIDFGLPADIREEDIGELIIAITKSVDERLTGKSVYEYLPAGGRAVVAVGTDDGYRLFRFFSFESYLQNEDEDAAEYLKLYGINSPSDIDRIEFIRISEEGKQEGYNNAAGIIKDAEGVEKFYGYFSVLKNSNKEYFDRLFNYSVIDTGDDARAGTMPAETNPPLIDYAEDMPLVQDPDAPVSNTSGVAPDASDTGYEGRDPDRDKIVTDVPTKADAGGGSMPSSIEGSQGRAGNALDNSVFIRIYNKQGVYYETIYYPNIGFISRYKVSKDFAEILKTYM